MYKWQNLSKFDKKKYKQINLIINIDQQGKLIVSNINQIERGKTQMPGKPRICFLFGTACVIMVNDELNVTGTFIY